jgi:hypothetical protein
MSKLLDYINHLDKNADARNAHAADPNGCMTNFGLSQAEQDALLSGDHQRIASTIGISVTELQTLHVPLEPY